MTNHMTQKVRLHDRPIINPMDDIKTNPKIDHITNPIAIPMTDTTSEPMADKNCDVRAVSHTSKYQNINQNIFSPREGWQFCPDPGLAPFCWLGTNDNRPKRLGCTLPLIYLKKSSTGSHLKRKENGHDAPTNQYWTNHNERLHILFLIPKKSFICGCFQKR